MLEAPENSRLLIAAIVGPPNVGKSTLLNALVGVRVSIVSAKVQTTRSRVVGIHTEGDVQLVLMDTPGIFKARKGLEQAMVNAAWDTLDQADHTIVLMDAKRGLAQEYEPLVKALADRNRKATLVINKVDLIEKPVLLGITKKAYDTGVFSDVLYTAALSGEGVDALRQFLADQAKPGPWLYPEDQAADLPERMLAAEITREKLFHRLHQEVPYSVFVETESWKESRQAVTIHQVVYVEKDSQKAIVLGKGGSMIRAIGEQSRRDLEEMLEKKVNLFVFVKVKEDWKARDEFYNLMGLHRG